MRMYNFKFIDLFAGLGGFHQAMVELGGECVFASEIDEECVKTYEKQFGMIVHGDINENLNKIPKFDVLCAGFPCQPFSKAGKRAGFKNDERGKLFYKIIEILKLHTECKYIILENVRNLADDKEFWKVIQDELMQLDYYITEEPLILSPSDFGIPQNRERVYIMGIKKSIKDDSKLENGYIHKSDFKLEELFNKSIDGNANKVLDFNNPNNINYVITNEEKTIINAWEVLKNSIDNIKFGAPVWVDFFGYGYNENQTENFYINNGYYTQKVKAKKEDYDDSNIIIDNDGMKIVDTPKWKQDYISKNRLFYLRNRGFIDRWINENNIFDYKKTYRKFEWNCGNNERNFRNCIIQFRQSGIRLKKNDTFPSLVAIVNTPIIWDDNLNNYRRITPREAANLQSFKSDYIFLSEDKEIYKQLGNSVNVDVIKIISKKLFNFGINGWDGDINE